MTGDVGFDEMLYRTSQRWKDIKEGLEALRGQLKEGKPGRPADLVEILLDNARRWHQEAVTDWKEF